MTEQKRDLQRIHKAISDYGVEDYYRDYKKKLGKDAVTYKEYTEIIDLLFTAIRNKMSTTMYDFKLPYSLGRIVIRKYIPKVKFDKDGNPTKRLAPNWAVTKQLWNDYPEAKEIKQLVYHTNEHSSGYLFMIDYKKDSSRFTNKIFYFAQMNRQFKRDVSRSITDGTFDSLESTLKY
jgi:hypothetical protein